MHNKGCKGDLFITVFFMQILYEQCQMAADNLFRMFEILGNRECLKNE